MFKMGHHRRGQTITIEGPPIAPTGSPALSTPVLQNGSRMTATGSS